MHIIKRLLSQVIPKHNEVILVKCFTQQDLNDFTRLTGDQNPLHSEETPAERRLVHGAFLNAIIAGIMGTQLPGPGTIVISQHFKFPKPCRINTETIFKVHMADCRKIVNVQYEAIQGSDIVLKGEAKLLTRPIIE